MKKKFEIPSELTLSISGGGMVLVDEVWDCECEGTNMFNNKGAQGEEYPVCPLCGVSSEEMSDSRLNELITDFPEVENSKWVVECSFFGKLNLDKEEVKKIMDKYAQHVAEGTN